MTVWWWHNWWCMLLCLVFWCKFRSTSEIFWSTHCHRPGWRAIHFFNWTAIFSNGLGASGPGTILLLTHKCVSTHVVGSWGQRPIYIYILPGVFRWVFVCERGNGRGDILTSFLMTFCHYRNIWSWTPTKSSCWGWAPVCWSCWLAFSSEWQNSHTVSLQRTKSSKSWLCFSKERGWW